MKINAKNVIEKYGQNVKIFLSDNIEYKTSKAFIQPQYQPDFKNIFGYYSGYEKENTKQFLYIGLPGTGIDAIPEDSIIKTKTETYILKSAKKVVIGDEILYERAIIEKQ